MIRVSTAELRKHLSDNLSRVAYQGERILVQKNGKDTAALISIEDAELLERLEDEVDLRAARRARKLHERSGGNGIPWAQVKREAGLK